MPSVEYSSFMTCEGFLFASKEFVRHPICFYGLSPDG